MNTVYDMGLSQPDKIVYIRRVNVAELPDELRRHVAGAEQIFAVHSSDGERLALVRDRKLAFALARQNDFAPVNVH